MYARVLIRSLKSDRVNYRRYQTRHQAMGDIIDYIEPFYNQKRRHAKLVTFFQWNKTINAIDAINLRPVTNKVRAYFKLGT